MFESPINPSPLNFVDDTIPMATHKAFEDQYWEPQQRIFAYSAPRKSHCAGMKKAGHMMRPAFFRVQIKG
jgi:hypothetical protein